MTTEPMTEDAFINQYEGYIARRVARDAYRAMHPVGMHTNGPTLVRVEISHVLGLLRKFRRADDVSAPHE